MCVLDSVEIRLERERMGQLAGLFVKEMTYMYLVWEEDEMWELERDKWVITDRSLWLIGVQRQKRVKKEPLSFSPSCWSGRWGFIKVRNTEGGARSNQLSLNLLNEACRKRCAECPSWEVSALSSMHPLLHHIIPCTMMGLSMSTSDFPQEGLSKIKTSPSDCPQPASAPPWQTRLSHFSSFSQRPPLEQC